MFIKEELEDPALVQRIHAVLVPPEFTRLDEIAELLFSAAKDIKQDQPGVDVEDAQPGKPGGPKFTPVAFHEDCMKRVEATLGVSLVKRTRAGYSSPDNKTGIICSVSKEHSPESTPNYWFAFHPHQQQFLQHYAKAFVAFGCGSPDRVILVPYATFKPWLEHSWTTTNEERTYWHVVIYRKGESYTLRLRKGRKPVDLSGYALPTKA